MARTTYSGLSITVSPAASGLVASPSWMSSLQVGKWATWTPTNTYASAFRTGVLAFIGNEEDILRAYSGSVLVPPGTMGSYPKGLQAFYGGGHLTNIPIPEVMGLDLSGPTWVALNTAPYDTTASASATYPAGLLNSLEPATPHTYDRIDYDPVNNSLFIYGLSTQQDSGSESDRVRRGAWFNFDTGTWDAVSNVFSAGGIGTASSTVYDSVRDCFWVSRWDSSSASSFGKISNSTDATYRTVTFTDYGRCTLSTDSMGTFDPVRNLVVYANFRSSTISVVYKDAANPGAADVRLTVSSMNGGASATGLRGQGCWAWSETKQGIIWTSNFNTAPVYLFKVTGADPSVASSWTVTSLLDAGNTVVPTSGSSSNGGYSKMRLVRYSDMEILIGITNESTYRYIFRIA